MTVVHLLFALTYVLGAVATCLLKEQIIYYHDPGKFDASRNDSPIPTTGYQNMMMFALFFTWWFAILRMLFKPKDRDRGALIGLSPDQE